MKSFTVSFVSIVIILLFAMTTQAQTIESDVFDTGNGKLTMYFIKHGTLMFNYNGYIIHIDPVGRYTDYSKQPKADMILITHEHGDHLDLDAIALIKKPGTKLVVNSSVYDALKEGTMMKNGDEITVDGIKITAFPAYNTTEGRTQYHPQGRGNGYILQLGNKRVYIAADTEDIPEMATLKDINIAFLPVNQPYTMTPEQAAHAAKMFKPAVLYPYHYGDTDIQELSILLKDEKGIDVRIRQLQ